MQTAATTIAIVGGGISGLSTAYFLEKEARAAGRPLQTIIIEREAQLGGKIATTQRNGFVFEGGPESFVTRKPEAWELCRELGLQDRLVGTAGSGKNYVLHNGRPRIVPTNPITFATSPLLSGKGKLRILKEPFVPPRADNGDESLGAFLRRRIGDEAVDNLAKPAISAIYLGDVDQMSVQVSFDRFAQLERENGSLVKGMFALMKQKKAERKASGQPRQKKPPFATLRGGLMELVEALAEQIEGEILTDTAVTALHYKQQYELVLADGRTLTADAVILAIPTYAMADLLAEHDARIAGQLGSVIYTPVTTVNVAFNRQDVPDPFDGFGVVIPESEASQLLAVEGMSVKFPHRAPDDQFVLRAFVGGQSRTDLVDLPDDELIALVRQELAAIFGIEAEPTAVHITRWQPANPQPAVGHLALITEIEERLQTSLPRLYLTGAGMRGQGIPDCIRQSQALAEQVWQLERGSSVAKTSAADFAD